MVNLKNWPAACIQPVFSVGSSARVGGTEDAQPGEAGGAGQGQPDRADRARSTGLRAPEGNDAALPRRLAARACSDCRSPPPAVAPEPRARDAGPRGRAAAGLAR